MPAALLTAAGTEGVAGAGSWRGRGDAQEAPELIGTGALSHGGSTEGAGVRSRHSEPLAARARPPWCSGQRATVSRSGARGPGEGGRWWLRVCPAALGRGEQGPVPRGFALGGGMCCDCCSCREPRAPTQRDKPCCPGPGSCRGNPRLPVLVGRRNHAGILQCGGSLCDFCARGSVCSGLPSPGAALPAARLTGALQGSCCAEPGKG